MKEAYCEWYDKKLKDVAEHQYEACKEAGKDCEECEDRTFREFEEDGDEGI